MADRQTDSTLIFVCFGLSDWYAINTSQTAGNLTLSERRIPQKDDGKLNISKSCACTWLMRFRKVLKRIFGFIVSDRAKGDTRGVCVCVCVCVCVQDRLLRGDKLRDLTLREMVK